MGGHAYPKNENEKRGCHYRVKTSCSGIANLVGESRKYSSYPDGRAKKRVRGWSQVPYRSSSQDFQARKARLAIAKDVKVQGKGPIKIQGLENFKLKKKGTQVAPHDSDHKKKEVRERGKRRETGEGENRDGDLESEGKLEHSPHKLVIKEGAWEKALNIKIHIYRRSGRAGSKSRQRMI